MKIIITLCLSLIASLQFVQAEPVIIGNNSFLDFSSLDSGNSEVEFKIENHTIADMILGDTVAVISNIKWNDSQMADYQQRYGSNPHQLILAAFNNKKDPTPEEQAETFSTRDGSALLYLYLSDFQSEETNQKIGVFFIKDAQNWFSDKGLMPIPDAIYQQNLVELGLQEAVYEGGHK
ncbi:hypothetical protein E2R68_00535 [Psychromonas sp. RZ22]|uniref:hypothetical protein n=1 Tax=Psychromonas algarum TaxID=2555643 RepID=UPI0010671E3B|nr:hypothetical protein [Psychromonas sp. RZ22]TEW56555.1 hypothetical protein E2R68_00535 [Psychromonas sp. RZ22]